MSSGYVHCGCPTCFEIAIADESTPLALCHACEEAGCDGESDCCAPEWEEEEPPAESRAEDDSHGSYFEQKARGDRS